MWNKIAEILQDPSYKRLGIAVFVSAILHALLFGGFDFRLPNLKDDTYPIEARIQQHKSAAPQLEKTKEEAIAPKSALAKPPKSTEVPKAVEPKVEEVAASEKITETPVEPALGAVKALEDISNSQQQTENVEPQDVAEKQQSDAGLVINENAYQYVETDFDVRTEVDGSAQGVARITYNLVNGRYQLSWLTKGIGLAALLFPDLLQNSEGGLTKAGLQPNRYLYQFGSNTDKSRTVNFDWQAKKVTSLTSKGSNVEDLPDGTQDLLSFMYQFMHVTPLQQMHINIATGKKLSTYDYSFEGEETINSGLGELKAIHIVHSGNDADERTELWLAVDYQYIPVKIRKIEKNGKVVEMVVKHINTSRPKVEQ